jgi:hypothetical protein
MARKKSRSIERPRRTQSSELAGGSGFTFGDAVSAYYLAALLGEGYAPGIEHRTVCRVALEQREFEEPLDDVIVDFQDGAGNLARLSLQVKRALTISAAKTNTDFREIIRDSWATYQKPDFRKRTDRFGVAVGHIAKEKARSLTALCEFARASDTLAQFKARFAKRGSAGAAVKKIKTDIAALLRAAKGHPSSDAEMHEFLAHFVLLEFDFLHEGASDPPAVMTRLRDCLAADHATQSPVLWSNLRQLARDGAGKSAGFERSRLVHDLLPVVRLRAAASLRADLDKITALTRSWLADIQNDVGGTRLDRQALFDKLNSLLTSKRFIQIRGLAGSGKSVLLRQQMEADLARGPVVFLKSDRLEGKGWASFAAAHGLSGAPLSSLLAEVAATGSNTLFIDGIDRIEKEHQPIVLDVLRAILGSPLLKDWKIVVSLRDTGIEPLRNWLGEVLNTIGIGTIEVGTLDEGEAEALAEANPRLRALLFGPAPVKEIVRRPFFAKVLSQGFRGDDPAQPFEPQSEVDLIENWWTRGGYDATGRDAIERQRAIVEIAAVRARQLSQPVALGQLSATTIAMIDQLSSDGILQHVKHGHTVRFSHDIFFEWSFFHVLTDRGAQWLDEIRACGEPPAVARVVELLSQAQYGEGQGWTEALRQIAVSTMRSQWARAWLLAPFGTAAFEGDETQFAAAAAADNFHFLRKALVWFQAEKTTPNVNILAADLPQDQRIRMADLLGWPSDFIAWRRFIAFLLARANALPVALYPDIISVFEVWQNALASLRNPISRAVVTQCADWLREVDELGAAKTPTAASRWKPLEGFGDFRKSLVRMILRSAATMPQAAEEYLNRVIASDNLRDETFNEIIGFSPTVASTHAALLVDLTLKHLKEELPDDHAERMRKERAGAAEARRKALAKPEAERTRRDEMILAGGFSIFGSDFSSHDWDTLAIDRGSQSFWPPSPLREPFHSLFKASPQQALRLFSDLCNHAMTAWRQLHRHVRDSPGTPIALEMHFPWDIQQFWGGDREYLWCRGVWAPKPLACGFMALEEWCFAELDRGRSVDELIREIVQGNQNIAILGTATMLASQTEHLSDTVLPLITSQRLWFADHHRRVQDTTSSFANLIGFTDPNDLAHVNAVKAANARPVRAKELSWLAPHYVLSNAYRTRAKTAILAFKDNLPYQIEEHRSSLQVRDFLMKQALQYAELADLKNYVATEPADEQGVVEVMHVSPSASKPENIAKMERATLTLQEGNLWSWASKAFENGQVGGPLKIPHAIALARKLDSSTLYARSDNEETIGMRRGAIAATAAVTLSFREGRTTEELSWARDILSRALGAPEKRDILWSASSVIPWHHAIFVVRGLVADVRHGTGGAKAVPELLSLVAHPLEVVSLAALKQIATLWDMDAKLVWAALGLALTLCHIEPRPRVPPRETIHSPARSRKCVNAALKYYKSGKGWPELPLPPPTWIKAKRGTLPAEYTDDDFDDSELTDPDEAWTTPPWQWYSQYASKIMEWVPYEQILASGARDQLLRFLGGVLQWTNQKNAPPWVKKRGRDRASTELFEWTHGLGQALGRIAGLLPIADAQPHFLEPIFALEDDPCWALLAPFASSYVCRYIYDALSVPSDAVGLLDLCVGRLLQASAFNRESYRSGEFSGFDQPRLVETLLFVSVEHATMSARFVNGDWSEIALILPLIDRLVRAGGWSRTLMYHYLTLCERSKTAYPAEMFADQILSVLEDASKPPKGWHGTFIPARIAALVQHFAYRDTPMPLCMGQKLLRILDLLVDMGDRRSAALQLSESFREIKVA